MARGFVPGDASAAGNASAAGGGSTTGPAIAAGAGVVAGAAQSIIGGTGTILGGLLAKKVAEQDAEMLRRIGKDRVAQVRKEGRQVIGAQIAHRGASGVTMSGSSMDVLEHDAVLAEQRALNVRFAMDMAAIDAQFGGDMKSLAAVVSGASQIAETVPKTLVTGAKLWKELQKA